MKKIILLKILLLSISYSFGQGWPEHFITKERPLNLKQLAVGDLHNDIVGYSTNDNLILSYKNLGDGHYANPIINEIDELDPYPEGGYANGLISFDLFDADEDGDLDILIARSIQGPGLIPDTTKIAWIENIGDLNFNNYHPIITHIRTTSQSVPYLVDYDLDGDLDFYYYATSLPSGNDWDMLCFKNEVGDDFSGITIASGMEDLPSINYGDINNDNYVDASYRFYSDVYWCENTGVDFLDAPVPAGSGLAFNSSNNQIADFNGDGINDLLCIGENVYEEPDLDWQTLIFVDGEDNPYYDLSIADTSFISTNNRIRIGSNNSNVDAAVVDYDQDGDLDVIFKGGYPGDDDFFPLTYAICLLVNDGLGNFEFEYIHSFSHDNGSVNAGSSIIFEDLDGDALNEIIIADGLNEMATCIYRNLGDGNFSSPQTITKYEIGPVSLAVGELTGDDLPEVLTGSFETLTASWYFNRDTGYFSYQNVLIPSDYDLRYSFNIEAADLTNNGENDILIAFKGSEDIHHPNDIIYLKNEAGVFENHVVVDDNLMGRNGKIFIKTIDFDNDSDIDILVSQYTYDAMDIELGYDNFYIYLNNGSGSFTKEVLAEGTNIYNFDLADINNDGNLDIIALSYNDYNNSFWLSGNGDGTANAPLTLSPSYDCAKEIHACDMNGDGNSDVAIRYFDWVHSCDISLRLAWYEGDGSGGIISNNVIKIGDVAAECRVIDWNSDGYSDVVASVDGNLTLLLNNTFGGFYAEIIDVYSPYLMEVSDIDGDGALDVLVTGGSTVKWYKGTNDFYFLENGTEENFGNLAVYPNPFDQSVTIDFSEIQSENSELIIHDIMGKVQYSEKINGLTEMSFSKKELPSGIYFVTIKEDGEIKQSGKIVSI